jgi:hypothetical protein
MEELVMDIGRLPFHNGAVVAWQAMPWKGSCCPTLGLEDKR